MIVSQNGLFQNSPAVIRSQFNNSILDLDWVFLGILAQYCIMGNINLAFYLFCSKRFGGLISLNAVSYYTQHYIQASRFRGLCPVNEP